MTVIPGIISGSTIPSRETWNKYIKVTANMTETAIKFRRKQQLHQKRMKHFAMKMMRMMLGVKDDQSEEMIKNMEMEEILSNFKGDYKIEMLQKQRESIQKKEAAKVATMSEVDLENYKKSKRKREATRVATLSGVELENFRESKQKREAARFAALLGVELEKYKESNQKRVAASKRKRVAAMLELDLENYNESNRKRVAASK